MNRTTRLPARLLGRAWPVLVLLPCLAGCGENAAEAPTASAADASSRVTRDLVDGVPMGKLTAPVDVKFGLLSSPQPGTPFKVRVVLTSSVTVPLMQAEVSAGEGVVLLDPIAPVSFDKVSAGQPYEFVVTAQSAAAGGQVINVAATVSDPVSEQTRAVAFPVLVGGSAMPAPVTRAKPGPAGEAVVPLKGTETSGT